VAVHTPLFTLYSRSINAASRLYHLWLYYLWLYYLWLYHLWLYYLWLYCLWLYCLWLYSAARIPAVFTLPQRHRPVAVACMVCARAKVACDEARPCARCIRFDKAELGVETRHARRRNSAHAAGKKKKLLPV